jgi:hypothetical protein
MDRTKTIMAIIIVILILLLLFFRGYLFPGQAVPTIPTNATNDTEEEEPEINPWDIYTCGDVGDKQCAGTCPDEYGCWDMLYEDYWYCACMTMDGSDELHPEWEPGETHA